MERLSSISISLLLLIVGFGLSFLLFPDREVVVKEPYPVEIIKTDTVLRYIEKAPLIIEKVRIKVIRQSDTVIETTPFTARIDTVIRCDTVFAEYEFPGNIFSMRVKFRPDTLQLEKQTIVKTIEKDRPWWEAPAYLIGGTIIGFLLGNGTK